MHLNVLTNIQQLLVSGVGTDKTVVSVALGTALAYTFAIPVAAARDASQYYTGHYWGNADEFLSALNEIYLVEIETVHDVARTLWLMRYGSVHLTAADISDLAVKANPIRDYLGGYSLDDQQIKAVLATGVQVANLLCGSDLSQSENTVRG